jgi:uncharacterized phage protein (TIGR01671 family)
MREIKFRAWDMGNKEMIYDYCFLDKGNKFNSYVTIDNLKVIESVMQYTGIKDANGEEIYEGDILQDDDGYIDTVLYREDGYYHAGDWSGDDFIYLVIIGNIYENTELLEKRQYD